MLSASLTARGSLFAGGQLQSDGSRRRVRPAGRALHRHLQHSDPFSTALKTRRHRLYFSLMTTLIGLATSLFGWTRPTPGQLLLLVGCGFFGGMAQILVTLSLRFTDASLLAPFDYTTRSGRW